MQVLPDVELNLKLQAALSAIQHFDSVLYSFFNLLYLSGCRAREPYNYKNWTVYNPSTIYLQPEKDNNRRIFNVSELDPVFVDALKDGVVIYNVARYNTACFYFHRFFYYPIVKHNTRSLSLNLFRHNRAKQLQISGQTDEEIQNYLGEKDIKNSNNYIYSVLIVP